MGGTTRFLRLAAAANPAGRRRSKRCGTGSPILVRGRRTSASPRARPRPGPQSGRPRAPRGRKPTLTRVKTNTYHLTAKKVGHFPAISESVPSAKPVSIRAAGSSHHLDELVPPHGGCLSHSVCSKATAHGKKPIHKITRPSSAARGSPLSADEARATGGLPMHNAAPE